MKKRPMSDKSKAEPSENIENHLRVLRSAKSFSQGDLARMASVTRQAIYAIENNLYLPTTAVALRLARALDCRVDDLGSVLNYTVPADGLLLGPAKGGKGRQRVRVELLRDRRSIDEGIVVA